MSMIGTGFGVLAAAVGGPVAAGFLVTFSVLAILAALAGAIYGLVRLGLWIRNKYKAAPTLDELKGEVKTAELNVDAKQKLVAAAKEAVEPLLQAVDQARAAAATKATTEAKVDLSEVVKADNEVKKAVKAVLTASAAHKKAVDVLTQANKAVTDFEAEVKPEAKPEADKSEEEKPEDDKSEADKSEADKSEADKSEEEKSEADKLEDDVLAPKESAITHAQKNSNVVSHKGANKDQESTRKTRSPQKG